MWALYILSNCFNSLLKETSPINRRLFFFEWSALTTSSETKNLDIVSSRGLESFWVSWVSFSERSIKLSVIIEGKSTIVVNLSVIFSLSFSFLPLIIVVFVRGAFTVAFLKSWNTNSTLWLRFSWNLL